MTQDTLQFKFRVIIVLLHVLKIWTLCTLLESLLTSQLVKRMALSLRKGDPVPQFFMTNKEDEERLNTKTFVHDHTTITNEPNLRISPCNCPIHFHSFHIIICMIGL